MGCDATGGEVEHAEEEEGTVEVGGIEGGMGGGGWVSARFSNSGLCGSSWLCGGVMRCASTSSVPHWRIRHTRRHCF